MLEMAIMYNIWYTHICQKCLYTCICIHKWAKYSTSIAYLFLRFKWMSTPTLSWDEKQTHTYTSVLDCGVRLGDFAATRLSYCVIPVLCVALLVFLFVNNGLAARVYDHQTLLFIRASMVDLSASNPWVSSPHSLSPPFVPAAGFPYGGF